MPAGLAAPLQTATTGSQVEIIEQNCEEKIHNTQKNVGSPIKITRIMGKIARQVKHPHARMGGCVGGGEKIGRRRTNTKTAHPDRAKIALITGTIGENRATPSPQTTQMAVICRPAACCGLRARHLLGDGGLRHTAPAGAIHIGGRGLPGKGRPISVRHIAL